MSGKGPAAVGLVALPRNIATDIGCVFGTIFPTKTKRATVPISKTRDQPHQSISHADHHAYPKNALGDGRIPLSRSIFYVVHVCYVWVTPVALPQTHTGWGNTRLSRSSCSSESRQEQILAVLACTKGCRCGGYHQLGIGGGVGLPIVSSVVAIRRQPTGGRLQPVLMRPTPQLSFKTRGGEGGGGWGGSHTRTGPGRPPVHQPSY